MGKSGHCGHSRRRCCRGAAGRWQARYGQAGLGNFGNRAHFRRRRGWAGIASSICNADSNVRPLRSSDRHLFSIYVHHQVCIFAAFRTSTRSMTFTGSARRFRLAVAGDHVAGDHRPLPAEMVTRLVQAWRTNVISPRRSTLRKEGDTLSITLQ